MPDPIIISPAGFIAQYNYPTYPFRGVGQAPISVTPNLPGGSVLVRGVGQNDLASASTASGSMQIQLVTPTTTGVAVAFLVDNATSPVGYLGISLDSHLRPNVIIKNASGTTVGQTTNSGAFGTIGAAVNLLLSWNASKIVKGTFYASLKINGVFLGDGDWSTPPSAAWTPFAPASLLSGNLPTFTDFTPASGIVSVQLAPT